MHRTLLAAALALLPVLAVAHQGHGAPSIHGHATDWFGYVVLAAVVAGSAWFARRK